MIDFSIKNTEELKTELDRHQGLITDIEFLHKLQLCFAIYDLIKTTSIEAVKVAYTKSEYDDEGLDCGVYFDYRTKLVNYCEDYLDDSLEYYEKIGEDYSPSNASEEEKKEFTKYSKVLNKLNSLGTDFYGPHEKLSYLISDLSEVELKNDINHIVLTVCGKTYFDKWKISIEKNAIAEVTPLSKKTPRLTKKLKV